jgi:GNAT superfamily N-acetyltransferase
MMDVRRLTTGDEPLWRSALDTVFAEDNRDGRLVSVAEIGRALSDVRCYLLVATQESRQVGLLCAYRFPDLTSGGEIVYLYDIEVVAEQRQRGFGAELIRALVKCCKADHVKLIWAGTGTSNAAARRAFEVTGAELEGASYAEYEWNLVEQA